MAPTMKTDSALRHRKGDIVPSKKEDLETDIHVQNGSLLSWQEIPFWQRDNEYIVSGYRPATASLWQCIGSLGYIHNETGECVR